MFIQLKTRKYRLNQRAEQQQLTRERIVDATIALHEEIGHAVRFSTWQSLAEQELSPQGMAKLVEAWIEAAAA
jgi:hypothetical protein